MPKQKSPEAKLPLSTPDSRCTSQWRLKSSLGNQIWFPANLGSRRQQSITAWYWQPATPKCQASHETWSFLPSPSAPVRGTPASGWLSASHTSCLHCHLLAPLWRERFLGDACFIATSLCLLCVLVWRGWAGVYLGRLSRDCKLAFCFPYLLAVPVNDVWVEWKGHLIAWEAGEGPQTD